MTDDFHLENKSGNPAPASGEASLGRSGSVSLHRWMDRSSTALLHQPSLNANQRTSISAMISYISNKSGQSEFRLERKLSDRFNVPNPKFLPANDFDAAIRYLSDIIHN
jgi:hypothetical protein